MLMRRASFSTLAVIIGLLVSLVGVTGVAFAAGPSQPIVVGFDTISNISLNGVPGTQLAVAPGTDIQITASWVDSHAGYCPGCVDFLAVGFQGSPSPAGCLEISGHTGSSGTTTVDLGPAPMTAGVYNIVAKYEMVYYCSQYWDPNGDAVIAQVIADSTPPVITTPGNLTAEATSSRGANVTYADPTAIDDVSGSVPVSCDHHSGDLFPLGITTVTCTATDAAGNAASAAFTVTVDYSWSNALTPINADGSSIFKLGSTVPVKFQLTGASAGITDATATVSYAKVSSGIAGSVYEAVSTSAGTTGNLFRYDATSGQYIFNWSTKGLDPGTYQISIVLGDGVTRSVQVSLN